MVLRLIPGPLEESDEGAGHGGRRGTAAFDRGELETFSVKFR